MTIKLQAILNGFSLKQNLQFRVRILILDLKVKFNILNNVKPGSLYSDGMKPCIRWEGNSLWERIGENVSYFKNDILRN